MAYKEKSDRWAIISLVLTTLVVLAVSTYCFFSGWFIVHQNLFYIPIVISCMFFGRKGFIFSVIISLAYFSFILYFTNDFTNIWQAVARVFVFVIIAGIVAFLSMKRRCAEEKVIQAHAQLKSLIDSATQVSIIATDLSGKIVTFNTGAEHILGYSAEEMLNKPVSVIHLESELADRGKLLAGELGHPIEGFDVLIAYAEKSRCRDSEWTYVKKDGSLLAVNLVVTSVRNDTGSIIGFLDVANDVTERKQAETALRQSATLLNSTFTAAPICIMLLKERVVRKVNGRILEISGYTAEELIGKSTLMLYPDKAEYERIANLYINLRQSGLNSMEARWKHKNGALIHVLLSISMLDVNDSNAGEVATILDITERKKAEETLRNSEDKYRNLFESSCDAIMTMEPPSWKYTSGNPATMEMFRVKNEAEFLNYAPWELSPQHQPDGLKSADKAKEMIEIAMRNGSHFFEWTHKRMDGSGAFLTNVLLSRVQQGEKMFINATVRDITEQRRLEEELKMADEMRAVAEIRSRFTSMVSHELRSPLGAIKEGINLVLEGLAGNINDEQKDLLDTAKRNTDRLGRLINNVLDYQKIESGKMGFDILKNDINETVMEVYKTMNFLAKEKGLDFVVETDSSIPAIIFDKDRIIQVITNVVSNAFKYTEKGGVTISTKQEEDTVHVIVRDTGMGIKTDDMKKLFCAFEQLDSTRDRKKGGTGLGLAISKEIILAHQGRIWAESEPGKGSAFHFTIPKNLKSRKKLGEILMEDGKISENDLNKALDAQKKQE